MIDYTHASNHALLLASGLTREEVAQLAERSPATIDSYGRGRPMPAMLRRLLTVYAGACPWPGWAGWEVKRGTLYAPDLADGFTPGELRGWHFNRLRLEILERELATLKAAPAQFLLEFGPGASP